METPPKEQEMRSPLPMEATATLLALSTILISSPTLNLPTWGIFLGWAATSLSGKPTRATMGAIARTLVLGACCALATLLIQDLLMEQTTMPMPEWAATATAILLINPLMIFMGRFKTFAVVPGMFVGFSTVLATHVGGFGFAPGNPGSSFTCAIVMNIVGIGFSWAGAHFSHPGGLLQAKNPNAPDPGWASSVDKQQAAASPIGMGYAAAVSPDTTETSQRGPDPRPDPDRQIRNKEELMIQAGIDRP